jgi:hypothetical protein
MATERTVSRTEPVQAATSPAQAEPQTADDARVEAIGKRIAERRAGLLKRLAE